MKTLLRVGILAAACLGVTACGPKYIKDEVRQVQVIDNVVDDSGDDPELFVNIRDVTSGQIFKVDLGTECSQYPSPKGQEFLARFKVSAYDKTPRNLYYEPREDQVKAFLCP